MSCLIKQVLDKSLSRVNVCKCPEVNEDHKCKVLCRGECNSLLTSYIYIYLFAKHFYPKFNFCFKPSRFTSHYCTTAGVTECSLVVGPNLWNFLPITVRTGQKYPNTWDFVIIGLPMLPNSLALAKITPLSPSSNEMVLSV